MRGSGGTFGLQDDIMEHLVDFSVVLEVVGEELAGELEGVLLLVKAGSHEDLEACQLQFGEVKLCHICQEDGLPALDLLPDISRLVDHPFHFHFVLLAAQFGHDLLMGAELVGVVDVYEVGLDVVRDGLVVLGLPESGLPGGAVQPRLHHQRKLHQLLKEYTPPLNLSSHHQSLPSGRLEMSNWLYSIH